MTANSPSDSRNGLLEGSPFYILFPLHSAPLEVSSQPPDPWSCPSPVILAFRTVTATRGNEALVLGGLCIWANLRPRGHSPRQEEIKSTRYPEVPAFLPCPADVIPTLLFHYWQENVAHVIQVTTD